LINLSKSGLEFLGEKRYEAAMLRIIWRDGKSCSLDIYNELKDESWSMDRTTYIKAFKKYESENVLVGEPESDIKNARVWYSPHPECPDEEAFVKRRIKDVLAKLRREYPEYYHLSSL